MSELRDSFSIIVNRTQSEEIQRLQETFREIDADFNRRGLIRSSFPAEAKCKELKASLSKYLALILPKLWTAIRAMPKNHFSKTKNQIDAYFNEILTGRSNQIIKTAESITKSQGAPEYLKREFDSLVMASTAEFHNQIEEYFLQSEAGEKQIAPINPQTDEKEIWQQIKKQFNFSKTRLGEK